MIIVNIMGGLGNQMFQYATARSLAVANNTDCALEISRFDRCRPNKDHTYQLDSFSITARPASRWEVAAHRIRSLWPRALFRTLSCQSASDIDGRSHDYFYSEPPGSAFKSEVLKLGNHTYLTGYFNSYKYFEGIKDLLLEELVLSVPISAKGQELLSLIANSNSVGVHVRRGDYITNPDVRRDLEGILTRNYYENAFAYVSERVDEPHFFFFSNDIKWVKHNLHPPGSATYIDFNPSQRGFEDLWLMSRCKHGITAGGSTFSWWASYLNSHAGKIVVRTERTSNNPLYNNPPDYFPRSWHSVPS